MFSPLGKLLCVAALAGTALAQSISISITTPGTISAGQSIAVQIERQLSSSAFEEVGLAIIASQCPDQQCSVPGSGPLGNFLYADAYNPNPPASETVHVTVPTYFSDLSQLILGRFSLDGVYSTPKLEYATVNFTVANGQG